MAELVIRIYRDLRVWDGWILRKRCNEYLFLILLGIDLYTLLNVGIRRNNSKTISFIRSCVNYTILYLLKMFVFI